MYVALCARLVQANHFPFCPVELGCVTPTNKQTADQFNGKVEQGNSLQVHVEKATRLDSSRSCGDQKKIIVKSRVSDPFTYETTPLF